MIQVVLKIIDGKIVETLVPFDFPVETDEQKTKRVTSELISDYINYLDRTDHKMSSDYEPIPDEDIDQIRALRIERRRFIRENKNA